MTDFYLKIGDTTSFTKTVSESDVYQFAVLQGIFLQTMLIRLIWKNLVMVG